MPPSRTTGVPGSGSSSRLISRIERGRRRREVLHELDDVRGAVQRLGVVEAQQRRVGGEGLRQQPQLLVARQRRLLRGAGLEQPPRLAVAPARRRTGPAGGRATAATRPGRPPRVSQYTPPPSQPRASVAASDVLPMPGSPQRTTHRSSARRVAQQLQLGGAVHLVGRRAGDRRPLGRRLRRGCRHAGGGAGAGARREVQEARGEAGLVLELQGGQEERGDRRRVGSALGLLQAADLALGVPDLGAQLALGQLDPAAEVPQQLAERVGLARGPRPSVSALSLLPLPTLAPRVSRAANVARTAETAQPGRSTMSGQVSGGARMCAERTCAGSAELRGHLRQGRAGRRVGRPAGDPVGVPAPQQLGGGVLRRRRVEEERRVQQLRRRPPGGRRRPAGPRTRPRPAPAAGRRPPAAAGRRAPGRASRPGARSAIRSRRSWIRSTVSACDAIRNVPGASPGTCIRPATAMTSACRAASARIRGPQPPRTTGTGCWTGAGTWSPRAEAAPHLDEQRLRLGHPARVRRERQAGVVVLALHVAGTEAELEPAVGERVDRRDLAGEQRRVPEVGVEDVGAQAQPPWSASPRPRRR